MNNLTDKQKQELFNEMLKTESPENVLTYMLVTGGGYALDANAGELSISTEVSREGRRYKLEMMIKTIEV